MIENTIKFRFRPVVDFLALGRGLGRGRWFPDYLRRRIDANTIRCRPSRNKNTRITANGRKCPKQGFMWEAAREFGALVVFAEHRYYGESLPYGSRSHEDRPLGYLTSQQALADFVDLVAHLRNAGGTARRGKSANPVIAFGGSYGGMLAAWFRIKYPAVVEGYAR